jgi:two-component sensor histidine kinase
VKNLLTVVTALARRTLHSSASPDAFVSAFEGRLKAFGRTHNALTQDKWAGVMLRQLVSSELQPYKEQYRDRMRIDGPPVLLRPKAALALGMTLHELASNAVKFGAFSSAAGRVDVTWETTAEEPPHRLVLRWREAGGPKVSHPVRKGLGRKLIEETLHYELGAAVRLAFEPQGVSCVIEFDLTKDVGEIPPVVELKESES